MPYLVARWLDRMIEMEEIPDRGCFRKSDALPFDPDRLSESELWDMAHGLSPFLESECEEFMWKIIHRMNQRITSENQRILFGDGKGE